MRCDKASVVGLSIVAMSSMFPSSATAGLLDEDHDWPAGTIQQQLDADPTLVPFGKGAIFVPSLTNPLDEPPVTVYRAGKRIDEGTTGLRIIVAPGTYEVRLGSGALEARIRVQTTVRERHTTVVPVTWSALSIHVVDEQFGSLRGSYELIRVEDREYIGLGFGTDEQAGEPLSTWVLPPGLYKIVRLGQNYRARSDFSSVRLEPGAHTHFLLVQDEAGAFKGAGEVPAGEIFRPAEGIVGSLILGADASLNSRRNVIGLEDGDNITFRLFLDGRLSLDIFDNPLVVRLQVEQGQTKAADVPWQKSNDIVDLDVLYVYKLTPIVGPYVQVGADTRVLRGFEFFPDEDENIPHRITRTFADNTVVTVETPERVQISQSFGLTRIREGAGVNVRLFKSVLAETNLRVGLGGRHRFARGLFESLDDVLVRDDPNDPTSQLRHIYTYSEIPSSQLAGAEATIVGFARLTRWVFVTYEADIFLPTRGVADTIVELETSVAVKLTSYLSLNYVFRFNRDPNLSESNRTQNDVLLRFSWELL